MGIVWNPEAYLCFVDERTRPAVDLLAQVEVASPRRVLDLGCGPGTSTALLAARWPEARIQGVDHSPEMLARARASGIRADWCEADLTHFEPEGEADLLFSNAALHWLPEHEQLLPKLFGWLAPDGALAVQMPRNFEAPSHVLVRVALESEAPEALAALRPSPVLAPEAYFDLLAPLGARLDLWTTTYMHVLDGDDPVLHWVRSTALRPVQAALGDEAYARFEQAYAKKLRLAYPKRPDGRTLLPFQRLFLIARRPATAG